MVRGVQVQARQPEQRRDEALGLSKRQVEEHAQAQRGEDRQVRVARLPSTTAGRRRRPGTQRLLGEPDGDVAEAHITEFQCPEVVCPACGKTTQAPVPDEVKRQCGAQLTALIAYRTVVCRLPRRVVQRLLEGALSARS